ncbi:MAG: hypothetical protein QM758_20715 [Armatimonas sp.]
MPFFVPFFPPVIAQEVSFRAVQTFSGPGGVVIGGPGGAQGQPLMQMEQALPNLAWKVSERGPLMIVGANKIQVPELQTRMQRQTLPTMPPPNTAAKAIADLFEYRVEKVGTLHALIPAQIKKFDGAPNMDPSELLPLERHELAQELGYSLTKDQWAALSGPNGLGMNNLTPKQQALFLGLLPDPIRIRPTNPPPNGQPGRPDVVELTPDQRSQVRLRMDRRLQVSFMSSGNINTSVSFGDGPGQKPRPFYMEYSPPRKEPLYDRVAPLVPNKPKPSDLDFNAQQLDPHVLFEGIQTVEQLMAKLRETTGAKVVLADPRLGSQSVKFWGESARAGDILQALCRSIGGTFRKVGTGNDMFFVLTDDQVGLGTRLAAFQEWRNSASSLRWKQDEKRRKGLESLDIRGMATLDDPFGLSTDQLASIEKSRWNPGSEQDRGMSVANLPPALQSHVQQTLDKNPTFRFNDGSGEQEASLRKDRVMVNASYRLQMSVPGWGDTDAYDLWGLVNVAENADNMRYMREHPNAAPPKPEPKPLQYPAAWRVRALSIRPKDTAEAHTLAKLAKANGFTTLWLTVPADITKARPLIEAAQAEKIPVVAVISLLQVSKSAIPAGTEPDISIMGETSDQAAERARLRNIAMNPGYPFPAPTDPTVFLAPTAAAQKIVIERAAGIAKIPGLAALVMRSITPPGYGEPSPNYYSTERAAMGYTLDNRLAFLQKESTDPIDLGGQYVDSRLVSPFFQTNGPNYIQLPSGQFGPDPNWKDRQRLWSEFLFGRITGFKKALFTRLKEVSPMLPLWVSPNEVNNAENFLSLWEKPEAKLAKNGNPWEPSGQLALARSFSSTALTQLPGIWRDDKKKLMGVEWRASMVEQIKQATKANNNNSWAGFFVDMTSLSAEDITEQLPFFKENAPLASN